jgi:twinkle protein
MNKEFKIKDYNIYKLDSTAKKSTCPICSENRKKKSQKCMMLDWERGLGTCQHCGEVLQLHTYEVEDDYTYTLPSVKQNKSGLHERVIDWFKGRSITDATLKKMNVTQGVEFMPQVGKEVNDEAGEHGKKELIRRFGSDKIFLCDLKDCKDANEYLIKYGKDYLKRVVLEATPCPIENVLRVSDMNSDLDDFYKNGIKNGYKIGLSSFDGIFSTYTKQFIVVTGFPSSGKSDFVDQMTVGYNMMYGWKTAYASTENYPQYLHVDKLIRKLYGSTPKYKDTKKKDWKDCVEHINKNFFFIDYEDGFDLDRVLSKGEELVKRMGIRCLVIDPYNKIRDKDNMNMSITDYTNSYLNKIDTFCKKNDVVCILVAHPTKPQNDKGKLIEPTFYDVKGGGEFYDMSPHGILVHRDYENATVKIKVLKVKFANLGENQAHVDYCWNVNNGRYSEIRNGNPVWDNTNWISTDNNPYETTKHLDLEFKQIDL